MTDKSTHDSEQEQQQDVELEEEAVDLPPETEARDPEPEGEQAEQGEVMTLEQALTQLAEAQQALLSQQNEVLRVQAEMQNLRRRTEQDVEKAHKYGVERFVSELLPVIDNLERALQVGEQAEEASVKSLFEGVELTLKSFLNCLKKFAVEPVDPLGEPFDPQLHQAMSLQESAEAEPDTVIAVMQKGYTLHGRVIRPAMVMVSKAPTPQIDENA